MYKYVGFGILTLVAILMIPAQDAESITNPSMYGMATLSVHDSAGNTLLTNIVHNEVEDLGTRQMLGSVFDEDVNLQGAIEADSADAICLTDASDFGLDDAITSTNFSTDGGSGTANNGLDNGGLAGLSCKAASFVLTNTNIVSGTINFAAGGTNVPDGTTITGFATCDMDVGADFCDVSSVLVSAIVTSVTLGTGETVDITYSLTLD